MIKHKSCQLKMCVDHLCARAILRKVTVRLWIVTHAIVLLPLYENSAKFDSYVTTVVLQLVKLDLYLSHFFTLAVELYEM